MKKFFVLGKDIGYSLSPKIYSHMFRLFGDDAIYEIKDVDSLRDFADITRGYNGFNVTKPFKTEIIKYLRADLSGCGSVNTVTADLTGYSTDGDGFLFDLERNFPGASSSRALVLGYGGAARACVHALVGRGADVRVYGRDESKTLEFARSMGIEPFSGEFVPDGVISCVTETIIPPVKNKLGYCYDVRYNGKTLDLGCPSANGLGMLIAQAVFSYGIFMQKRFDKKELKSVYLSIRESL